MLILLLSISVCTSVYLFHTKYQKQNTEIDNIRNGLSGMLPFVSNGSAFNFVGGTPKVQLLLWSRYALFPIQLDRIEDKKRDTALVLFPIADTVASILDSKKIIWSNKDAYYQYYLICRP
jgi:hypothetical protein